LSRDAFKRIDFRRNAEKLVEAASQNGLKLTVEDIMELNQEKLIPFLLFLTKK